MPVMILHMQGCMGVSLYQQAMILVPLIMHMIMNCLHVGADCPCLLSHELLAQLPYFSSCPRLKCSVI